MFGYVRPFKPRLRVYEWELYNGMYCGLCRRTASEYGAASAAMLSYDMVFLALVAAGLETPDGTGLRTEKCRCPIHPLKKRLCVYDSGRALDYAAAVQVILAFHKLTDDLRDKDILHKLRAAAVLPFMLLPYRKAAAKQPRLAAEVRTAMKEQHRVEASRTESIDRAAEPTAAMTAAVFRELGGCDPDMRDTLGEFGYMLGRYIYISDALDDLRHDLKNGGYNPLLAGDTPPRKARLSARYSVYMTLGRLGELYSRLPRSAVDGITDNIVYDGLRQTFDRLGKRREAPHRCRDCAGCR